LIYFFFFSNQRHVAVLLHPLFQVLLTASWSLPGPHGWRRTHGGLARGFLLPHGLVFPSRLPGEPERSLTPALRRTAANKQRGERQRQQSAGCDGERHSQ